MRSPLYTLHTHIVLSTDPEAKYSPSVEKSVLVTLLVWPFKVFMSYPFDTPHIPIVWLHIQRLNIIRLVKNLR